jgi:hypothetical protein
VCRHDKVGTACTCNSAPRGDRSHTPPLSTGPHGVGYNGESRSSPPCMHPVPVPVSMDPGGGNELAAAQRHLLMLMHRRLDLVISVQPKPQPRHPTPFRPITGNRDSDLTPLIPPPPLSVISVTTPRPRRRW